MERDDPALVCDIVLSELVWVLESACGYDRRQIAEALERMNTTPVLRFQDPERAHFAIAAHREAGIDLSDVLIVATCLEYGCEQVRSFDRKARRLGSVASPWIGRGTAVGTPLRS